MASQACAQLGPRLRGGLVISPTSFVAALPLDTIRGQHPEPGDGSERGGRRALDVARGAGRDEELLVLLSGGASALMAIPAEGITLEDKRRTTNVLLRAGADIHALNTVRKHLSAIKGGWLAAVSQASCHTLAVSDVVGDDLSVIGSGPTVGDVTTFSDAQDVLARHGGRELFPPAVADRIARGVAGHVIETPKPLDPRLARSQAEVVGGRHDAMRGAAAEARSRGFHVHVVDAPVVGEARRAARRHLEDIALGASALPRPLCVLSSGETTVAVHGRGRGGRNQEFALAAVDVLPRLWSDAWLASVGTDGVDGPTDAAGALVDSTAMARARHDGLVPQAFLEDNNSYEFFQGMGDLIRTGPTGTNVGDLQVLLLA